MNEAHNRNTAGSRNGDKQPVTLHLPAPTAWPVLMSLGLTLVGASLVTNIWLIWLGALLFLTSALGWFRNVLPHEAHEDVPVAEEHFSFLPVYENVARIEVDATHRASCRSKRFLYPAALKAASRAAWPWSFRQRSMASFATTVFGTW